MRRTHVIAYLLVAFAFLYLRTFLLPGVPLAAAGDETMFFDHGIRLIHGQIPYVSYEDFVMPGCDFFYAAAFYLFGMHAWLAQGFLILLGVSLSALLLWISSGVLPGYAVFLPGLVFLAFISTAVMDATHHWYSDVFVLAAVGILLGGQTQWRLSIAGVLCGLATVFTQSQGLLGFLAIAGWLYWTSKDPIPQRLRRIFICALPFLVVVGSVLGWLIHRSGYSTIYFSLVTFVVHYFPTMTANMPLAYFLNHPTGLGVLPYLFVHFMLPFGYLWALIRLYRERKSMDRTQWNGMLLVSVVGLALFLAVASAPLPRRMVMVAPPAAIVFVWLLQKERLRQVIWVTAGVWILALPSLTQRHWRGYLDLPYGRTAYLQRGEFEEARWLATHTHAGEPAFLLPRTSFQLALNNPTPLDYITSAEYTTPEQVQRAIDGIRTRQAEMVALPVPGEEIHAPRHPGNNLAPLIAYVQANYHQTNTFVDCQIWERNGR